MVIKYKNYTGVLIYAYQVRGSLFDFRIVDSDGISITFKAEMNEIRIVNCPGNMSILEEVIKPKER